MENFRLLVFWYLVIQLIAVAALPLSYRVFRFLPDRGYSINKSLGILLVGLIFWSGTVYSLWPNTRWAVWLALLAFAGISLAFGRRILRRPRSAKRDLSQWLRANLRVVWVTEAVFLLFFGALALLRFLDPAANHTEQPMDLMFLNGVWSSPDFPPQDPWLSGYPISYYYLGYWLLMTVARLANQPPEIAYTLGQASWYALLMTGSFGIGFNLCRVSSVRNEWVGVRKPAYVTGLITALAVGAAGNLEAVLEWLYARGLLPVSLAEWVNVRDFPEKAAVTGKWFVGSDWWWWRSSRVIQDQDLAGSSIEVITEFPSFSFVLGDNHPHLLATPFILLLLALALNLFLGHRNSSATVHSRNKSELLQRWGISFPAFWVSVAVLGTMVSLNTWDFPLQFILMILAFWFAPDAGLDMRHKPDFKKLLLFISLLAAGVLLHCWPYLLTAQNQVAGLNPNLFHPTQFRHFFLMFAPALIGVLLLIFLAWKELRPVKRQLTIVSAMIFGGAVLFFGAGMTWAFGTSAGRFSYPKLAAELSHSELSLSLKRWLSSPSTLVLICFILVLVVSLLWRRSTRSSTSPKSDPAVHFALILSAVGLLAVMIPEVLYLRDNFESRMNTVFKFYYQGWILLAIPSVFASTRLLGLRRRETYPTVGLALCSLFLVFVNSMFLYAAAYNKVSVIDEGVRSLSSIDYLRRSDADVLAAIQWIRNNTDPEAVILEAPGHSYRSETNRISAATGRSTLLGWQGHEMQWRGKDYSNLAGSRLAAVEQIYSPQSATSLARVMADLDVTYVYYGPIERDRYPNATVDLARFGTLLSLAFEQGRVRIYRRNDW